MAGFRPFCACRNTGWAVAAYRLPSTGAFDGRTRIPLPPVIYMGDGQGLYL